MVHSLLKRILSLEKTMKILHSSSSTTSIEDGESQIVKVTSVKFTHADDLPTKNNFSKNGTTSTLPSSSSSSFSTRSNCQDRKWMTCSILTILLLVLLVTILVTFYNPSLPHNDLSSSDNEYSVQLLNNNYNKTSSNTSSENRIIIAPTESVQLDIYDKESDNVEMKNNYEHTNNNNHYHGESKSKHKQNNFDLKTVSRLSWEILNRKSSSSSSSATSKPNTSSSSKSSINNSDRQVKVNSDKEYQLDSMTSQRIQKMEQDGIVLPSVMVFTSRGTSTNGEINNLRNVRQNNQDIHNKSKKSCCRTQKYTQTVKVDGCEPLTIVNRMCFGQCVSVWVPSLFASFPVCKPSRSTWKAVTLTCFSRDKKSQHIKRVKIEKIRRCSCMD